MKVRLTHLSCFVALGLLSSTANAQLSGTVTVPGSYPTLAAALSALNTGGVGAGGVVINLTAAETAPAGGYLIGSTALASSVSASNTVTINGNNNVITAFTGTGTRDAFFTLNGASYITINGFAMAESAANTTAATQMEYGVALFKGGTTVPYRGCQFNTVRNCTITLSPSNSATYGIFGAATTSGGASPLTTGATSADANSNNSFYGNTITGNGGISMTGFSTPSVYDYNNTYGVPTGNTINFGSSASTIYGIYTANDTIRTISNNMLATLPGITGGVIAVNTGTGTGNTQINNNTFRLASSGYIYGCNNGGVNEPNGSYNVTNNVFGLSSTSNAFGIFCSNRTFDLLSIKNNRVDSIISSGNSGAGGIQVSSYTTHKADISNNVVRKIVKTAQGIGTVSGINITFGNTATAGYSNTANNNIVDSIIVSGGTTGSSPGATGITLAVGSTQPAVCNNNKISNIVTTGDNDVYGMFITSTNSSSLPLVQLSSDSTLNLSATTGTATGICANLTATGGTIQNCKIYGLSSVNGSVAGLKAYGGSVGTEMIIANNNISGLTLSGATGSIYGMNIGGATTAAASIASNNMISGFTAPNYSSDVVCGVCYSGTVGNLHKLFNNTVYIAFTSNGTKRGAQGVNLSATVQNSTTARLEMSNNIINVDVQPAGNGLTAAFFKTQGAAGTVPPNLVNTSDANILYAPNVAGSYLYTEIVGPNGGLVNSYSLTNDPGFNKNCGRLKAFLGFGFRNATENNLVGGTLPATYQPANSSFAKTLAVTTAPAITTDYAGVTRPSPADAGALQFTATALDNQPPVISFTPLPAASCVAVPVLNAVITDASGVNTAAGTAPRLYYKKATEADTFGTYPADNNSSFNGWKYVEATGTAPNFSFSMDYSKLTSLPAGDSITYFVVAQDNAALINVGENVAALAAGYCASGVNLTPDAGPTRSTAGLNGFRATPVAVPVTASGPLAFCAGGSVSFTAALQPGATCQWMLNGSDIAGATSNTYTATTEGAYTVNVTLNACGGISTVNNVVVHALPDASLSYTGDTVFCQGNTLSLNVPAVSTNTYQWFRNGTLITSSASGASYQAGAEGTYQAVVTNESGCTDTSATVSVVVNPLPVPVITNNNNVLTTGSFSAYQWNMNGQSIAQATNDSYTCTQNGYYSVTVTDVAGCKGTSDSVVITGILGIGNVTTSGIKVNLYPNPVRDVLYIDASEPVNIAILSIDGKQLLYRAAAKEIQTGALRDGVYLVRLTDSKGALIRTDRLVKASR